MNTALYEERVIAFVDILGFGALVERSALDPSIVGLISNALEVALTENVRERTFFEVHESKVPPHELEKLRAELAIFNKAFYQQHQVTVSHFSDTVVLSAQASDAVASQLVVDLAGRLTMSFWEGHEMLVRGGITKGPLVHVQGGRLFGPAMNEAYHLESKIASFPRIVMSDDCWSYFSLQPTFPTLEFFFDLDEDGYRSMSLAGAYRQILEASPMFMVNPNEAVPMLRKLAGTPSRLRAIGSSFTENRVTSKYDWLIPRIEVLIERYGLTADPQASGK
ncbi:hypothetical protein [Rhizobium leguminosarum]|uniref:hypothetical protein n=1 Tax=Rhizobium leguminosarum TaxID=384 RepID=UPI00102FD02C|nr:hypothetical protein [Rhizobium leguminosarum]TAV81566.1 hypothetical protein ELI22_33980 [Rhizobium leguminosarum]TAV94172.1 hypothetical protein ELI21_10375 [Rhizobium leguminosarum]TAW35247.1 hypothetical protein ELI23_10415 [Rhizobium leguminosarum]